VIGIAAGAACYYAVAVKNRLKWDDAARAAVRPMRQSKARPEGGSIPSSAARSR
jgi:hypothetical protein